MTVPLSRVAPPSAPSRTGPGVVLLIRSLEYGGAERQVVELARGLWARGRRVVVGVFYGGGPLEAEVRAAGVPLVALGKRGRWDVAGPLFRLTRLLRTERPVALYTFLLGPSLFSIPARVFAPTRIVWGIRGSEIDWAHQDRFVRGAFRASRWLTWSAGAIIANSQAGIDYYRAVGYPAERIVRIPNGFDTERFRPDPAAGAAVRAEWGIAPDEVLIGVTARFHPHKDHRTFLHAAARIAAVRRDVRFVCIGAGDRAYRAGLIRLSRELGLGDRILWPEARSDMRAVYNAFDLLVSSSWSEGLSNALGEAMACGVPCVATDVGDSAWLVGDPEAVVPPRDPGALADACLRRLAADRDAIGRAARERIVTGFSRARMVEATEAVLWRRD